jgi:pantoate--beta-alanine ligase
MHKFNTKQQVTNYISEVRQGKSVKIAFVPTMGALHEGHLSLIKLAKQQADIVICSIFVNPTQFGPNEDFTKYPRVLEQDIKLLDEVFCDALFAPSSEEIYGNNIEKFERKIQHSDILCGAFRQGHFEGVVQIVGKLFDIVKPDVAIFGEKDFQQLFILKENFKNINIIGAPIIREDDGLAMSSRNKYLSESERKIAGRLNVVLKDVVGEIKSVKNGAEIAEILEQAKKNVISSGFTKIDYIEAREQNNLELTKVYSDNTRIFAAVWLGKTRLIDNFS